MGTHTVANAAEFDFFVIGGGSGGVRAARMAASYGAKTALCEGQALGGTCVNVGCIPKKLFVYGAEFAAQMKDAPGYGWQVQGASFHWPTLIANKNKEIARLNGVYAKILQNAGVLQIEGWGKLVDAHTVEVAGVRYHAKRILIATGGNPWVPKTITGVEHAVVSDAMFFLPQLPKSALVVGGGYIAVEFAGVLHHLGCKTTLAHRGAKLLRGFDEEVRDHLGKEMLAQGMEIRFSTQLQSIVKTRDGLLQATMVDATGSHNTLETELVLLALGRRPLVAGLGLDAIGVKTREGGAIVVDNNYATSIPNIYAIGDAIDRTQLTPIALEEGSALAKNLFNQEVTKVDYSLIPSAVFSHPTVGSAGLTEVQAKAQGMPLRIFESRFKPLKHTLSGRQTQTYMKLVVHAHNDKVVGCHVVGDDAAEMIQCLAVALCCDATKAQFDATLAVHPTAAEEWVTMREPTRMA